jgi:hypothetical protein
MTAGDTPWDLGDGESSHLQLGMFLPVSDQRSRSLLRSHQSQIRDEVTMNGVRKHLAPIFHEISSSLAIPPLIEW